MTAAAPSGRVPGPSPWEPDPEAIEWQQVTPPLRKARVQAEWDPAKSVFLYELCSAGGLRFIRRTRRTPYRVDESPAMIARRANVLWEMLVNGQVG